MESVTHFKTLHTKKQLSHPGQEALNELAVKDALNDKRDDPESWQGIACWIPGPASEKEARSRLVMTDFIQRILPQALHANNDDSILGNITLELEYAVGMVEKDPLAAEMLEQSCQRLRIRI
jgi:hypothetical protein